MPVHKWEFNHVQCLSNAKTIHVKYFQKPTLCSSTTARKTTDQNWQFTKEKKIERHMWKYLVLVRRMLV